MLSKKSFREKKRVSCKFWLFQLDNGSSGRIFVLFCFVRFCAYYCIVHMAQDTLTGLLCVNILNILFL